MDIGRTVRVYQAEPVVSPVAAERDEQPVEVSREVPVETPCPADQPPETVR